MNDVDFLEENEAVLPHTQYPAFVFVIDSGKSMIPPFDECVPFLQSLEVPKG